MNWDYVLNRLLLIFGSCFAIYISNKSSKLLFTFSRRRKTEKAKTIEILYAVAIVIGICFFVSYFIDHLFEEIFFIVITILLLPSIVGIMDAVSQDKKLSKEERLKLNEQLLKDEVASNRNSGGYT